jgi:5-methylcytosine-specific restriction endonuclease McrA
MPGSNSFIARSKSVTVTPTGKFIRPNISPACRMDRGYRPRYGCLGMAKTRAEYMRPYIKARKHARRARLIEMLGGQCVRCGATDNLHFDHINPATKRFSVGSDMSRAWELLVEEALKCQLLCPPCHVEKGKEDRPEPPHGEYRYWYWRCRCDVCRAANAAKSARQRRAKLEAARAERDRPSTLTPDRSGVAQSAEHPAVNRVVESSSLSPRAQEWENSGMILEESPSDLGARSTTRNLPVNRQTRCQLSYAGWADARTPDRVAPVTSVRSPGTRVAHECGTCFPAARGSAV